MAFVAMVLIGAASPGLANDTLGTADPLGPFTHDADPNIEASTLIPHASESAVGDGTYDFYSFSAIVGDAGVFDIDFGSGGAINVSLAFALFDPLGNLVSGNNSADARDGAAGSSSSSDPFLRYVFPTAGTWTLGVGGTSVVPVDGGLIPGDEITAGGDYTLNVSVGPPASYTVEVGESPAIGAGSNALFEHNTDGNGGFEEGHLFGTSNDDNRQDDAFDDVFGLQFEGTGAASLGSDFGNEEVAVSGPFYSFPLQTSGALLVQFDSFIDPNSPTARALYRLTNPTGSNITGDVTVESDLGSDSGTTVLSTSDGDTVVDANGSDRWTITDDSDLAVGGRDPVVTLVHFGIGAPETPDEQGGGNLDVFDVTFNDVTFNDVTVPASDSISFLLFTQLHSDPADASAAAQAFNILDTGDPLLANLTDMQLAEIVNWDFTVIPEPATPLLSLLLVLGGLAVCRRSMK